MQNREEMEVYKNAKNASILKMHNVANFILNS